MLFQTWTFFLFFAVLYLLFRIIRSSEGRGFLILFASLLFYALWNPWYIFLLLWIITADYTVVYLMERYGRRKSILALSVINSILVLGFFKYAGFLSDSINSMLAAAGTAASIPRPEIILPAGISFYIFISMGYVFDYYYGSTQREKSWFKYALFVSFFPQILAGPIGRAAKLLPQLRLFRTPSPDDTAEGIYLFTRGIFRKVVLADYFALYADKIFGNPGQYASADLALGALAFTWQIYFDFTGYTDMARGIARCLGIELMENFNLPYTAKNTKEFWARWHISLSSWFGDFVYKPLGGNRNGRFKESRNIISTMLLSGLWHGAAWNFLLWGLIHGILHSGSKLFSGIRIIQRVPDAAKRIITFILVVFTWIFFRAENSGDAFTVIAGIFSFEWRVPAAPVVMLALMGICYAVHWLGEYGWMKFMERPAARGIAAAVMVLCVLFVSSGPVSGFIYQQF
ncbi:MAG TPA: MBOAT family O-acyltransferase [Spirochaetota bacterium]|nr:MBOAT family O-acyltransferase [Spirochaetota bacterium]